MIKKTSLSIAISKYLLIVFGALSFSMLSGQTVNFSGTVKDAANGERLIGANIVYAPGKGMVTDIDGNFSFDLAPGNYEVHISFIGYNEVIRNIVLENKPVYINIEMESLELDEVIIVADIARERSTPIAFSSVSKKQISQEQGAQDLPMLLNYTPGVYATQQGGGDGDARINIRGFDQSNMAVMVDGIPVNDMENGWVYWSNWQLPVKKMQVQRGLSSSKLALPSVGGTINIITVGIDQKAGVKFKQDFSSGNYIRSELTLNSGRLKGDWGIVFNGTIKRGDGIVDQNFTRGFSYYLKVEKIFKSHRLSFMGMGAPQQHGQRSYKNPMQVYNREYAKKIGIADSVIYSNDPLKGGAPENGITYNEHWGTYETYEVIGNGFPADPANPDDLFFVDSTITQRGSIIQQNERINYYHKPLFALRDFWTINDQTVWINTLYASFGWGGGTGLNTRSTVGWDENDQLQLNDVYYPNRINREKPGFDDTFRRINPEISETEYEGTNYLRSSVNNHNWYGLLSQVTHKFNPQLTFSGGLDFRYYKGIHYREIYDIIGADYILENSDANATTSIKREGDKVRYYDEGLVGWGGLFTQLEYTNGKLSAFANFTASSTSYNGIDYYKPKTDDGKHFETGWQNFIGYTFKLGANYNINEKMNVFVNTGYLNNAPKFNSVIDISNNVIADVENEKVLAFELGYAYSSRSLSFNLNTYYTKWDNKPINRSTSVDHPYNPGENATIFISSMDALHMGVEFDAAWVFHPKWKIQALFSLGDWTWQSQEEVEYQDNGQAIVDSSGNPYTFIVDPRGVHVGDAAQYQLGGMLEYRPTKESYVRVRVTHFGKNFSNFNPESVVGEFAGHESWQIPNYQLVDFFAGYQFKLSKGNLNVGFIMNNLLNSIYISDALNDEERSRYIPSNDTPDFDAANAGVFPGLPRRYTLTLILDI